MAIADLAGNAAPDFTAESVVNSSGYTLELVDRWTDTLLADLTSAATFSLKPRRSGQPLSVIADIAADNADIRDTSFDGTRNLTKGIRTLKVRKNGVLVGHVIVWRLDYTGDENNIRVRITGYDPLIMLKGRVYRDTTGSMITPTIASPVAGATILRDGVDNSISNSGPAGDMEGHLPIDTTTGVFDETVPPAADLGVELADWPIKLSDLVTTLNDTGAVDIWIDPVETAMGYDAGIIGELNVANRRGTDISATVHFDFATGDRNARLSKRSDDMDHVANKVIYFLGPKVPTAADPTGSERWRGNISATETTPEDLSAFLALEEASRDKYDTIMVLRFEDTNGAESDDRKLWHVVWKEEVASSVEGQELVNLSPTADCVFEPFDDYNPGDTVGINVGDVCGPELTGATQRVDGFDVSVGADGVGVVEELLTLQDA